MERFTEPVVEEAAFELGERQFSWMSKVRAT